MGADAFFSPNVAQTDQQASRPVHQDTSVPVNQQGSTPVSQDTSVPAHQEVSKPVKKPLIKATFYLTPEHEAALEELRFKLRRTTGERTDKSELVRRAIDLLVNQYSS
jgi:hypothetical protein